MTAAGGHADIAGNLHRVRAQIVAACARVGRDPATIRLIAVTKEQGPQVLPVLAQLGVNDFGENRLEHLAGMRPQAPPGAAFHAIGRVQGRQLARIAQWCCCLHSLCEEEHIIRLERACAVQGIRLKVFLQVNDAQDPDKAGMSREDLPRRLALARAQAHLEVLGLMTMAAHIAGAEGASQARRAFASVRGLAQQHGLTRLSMGMSEDFEIAIEEGATDIRLGRMLFT